MAPAGAGHAMVWNPNKAAFRVGTVSGVQWDNINIAQGSVAMGTNTRASGNDAIAVGNPACSGCSVHGFWQWHYRQWRGFLCRRHQCGGQQHLVQRTRECDLGHRDQLTRHWFQ
ncbi:MAG: left-handed beta-roll domain-containing protein [Flavobacteriales bacterium]|nr:left-handed beta-roll domain-containing protein [Flavobacteriales bacterium]